MYFLQCLQLSKQKTWPGLVLDVFLQLRINRLQIKVNNLFEKNTFKSLLLF